jgi:hypothetical protein
MRTLACLFATMMTAFIASAETRVSETHEISKVPAGFPVGFALLTTPRKQYAAYYDEERQMTVACRDMSSSKWTYHMLPSKIGWDSHNYLTMALDDAGHLHVAGNMHVVPLIYFRTERPGDITSLVPAKMIGDLEKRVTYPKFFHDTEQSSVWETHVRTTETLRTAESTGKTVFIQFLQWCSVLQWFLVFQWFLGRITSCSANHGQPSKRKQLSRHGNPASGRAGKLRRSGRALSHAMGNPRCQSRPRAPAAASRAVHAAHLQDRRCIPSGLAIRVAIPMA